jgi:predicted porin
MNRKVLAVAVAAAFTAPAAFAQTSVTIGGTINIMWDYVKASGATQGAGGVNLDMKSHDRVRDGAGSNIRFFVNEELGGGNSAFVQVESAVIMNSDQRTNAVGGPNAGFTNQSNTAVWGNRNSAVGIRSKAAGRFLIGVWDLHYDETYKIDPGWLTMNSSSSILGLMNTFGLGGAGFAGAAPGVVIGNRYSNVIRWDSPVWGGFNMTAGYARPTDGAPVNQPGDVRDGKKNRAYNIAPRFETGGLVVQYSYLQDKDIGLAGTVSLGSGTNLTTATGNLKVTSNRIGVRYRFGMGLGIGFMYDASKLNITTATAGGTDLKRDVWSIPITYDIGNHNVNFSYSQAGDWNGNAANACGAAGCTYNGQAGINLANDTGARMWTLGYGYKLSKRTNVHVGYQEIKNDKAARYDFFANSAGQTGFGADPKSFAMGLRHTW